MIKGENKYVQENTKAIEKLTKVLKSNKMRNEKLDNNIDSMIKDIGDSIEASMEEAIDDLMSNPNVANAEAFLKEFNVTVDDVTDIFKSLGKVADEELIRAFKEASKEIEYTQEVMKEFNFSTEEGIKEWREAIAKEKLKGNTDTASFLETYGEKALKEQNTFNTKTIDVFKNSVSMIISALQVGRVLNYLDEITDTILYTSNEFRKQGVVDSSNIKELDAFIRDTQKELNDETGGKYKIEDLYKDMATLTQNTDIARMDTLKEITKPAMLAYKSMNVSLESIADFSGKLYEYAGYDSLKLERMLDYTKGISDGMNVNEQDIIEAQDKLSSIIEVYATKSGQDIDTEKLYNSIAKQISVLESSGLESKNLVDLIYGYLENPSEYASTMSLLGIDTNTINTDILSDEGWDKITDSYVKGLANLTDKYSGYEGMLPGNVSAEETRKAYLAVENGTYDKAIEQALKNEKDMENGTADTMADSVEDQYINVQDKIAAELGEHTSLLTEIKDRLGFGFSEIAEVVTTVAGFKTLLGGTDIFKNIFKGGGKLLSKGKDLFKNIFSNSSDDVIKEAAKSFTEYGDDAVKTGKGIFKSLKDTIFNYGDDVVKGVSNYGDDAAKLGGGIGSKFLASLGFIVDGVFGAMETKDWFGKDAGIGDYVSSTVGSMVGGTGSGWGSDESIGSKALDTIGNTAKWAGAGAAIGSIVPVIGTGIGALIGGGVGLVTSAIGGENIANGINKVGDSLSSINGDPINSYDVGTNYVDSDQLAVIHEGEAIIPKEYNPEANLSELEYLRKQESISRSINQTSNDKLSKDVRELINVTKNILTEFNKYSEEVEKRYNDDKLDNKVSNSQTMMSFRRLGIIPSK